MRRAEQACDANLLVFELNAADVFAGWVVLTIKTTLERSSPDRLGLEFDSQEIAWNVVGILYFVDFVDGSRRREAETSGLRRGTYELRVVPTSVSEDNRPAVILADDQGSMARGGRCRMACRVSSGLAEIWKR